VRPGQLGRSEEKEKEEKGRSRGGIGAEGSSASQVPPCAKASPTLFPRMDKCRPD
jgi:hypothetical protein